MLAHCGPEEWTNERGGRVLLIPPKISQEATTKGSSEDSVDFRGQLVPIIPAYTPTAELPGVTVIPLYSVETISICLT